MNFATRCRPTTGDLRRSHESATVRGGDDVRREQRLEPRDVAASGCGRQFLWNGLTLSWVDANGQPGVLLLRQNTVVVLVTIETSAGSIAQLRWMMRPSKLTALATFARQAPPAVS